MQHESQSCITNNEAEKKYIRGAAQGFLLHKCLAHPFMITSNTHIPNNLILSAFLWQFRRPYRALMMLIYSESCCSALVGTSVHTVS